MGRRVLFPGIPIVLFLVAALFCWQGLISVKADSRPVPAPAPGAKTVKPVPMPAMASSASGNANHLELSREQRIARMGEIIRFRPNAAKAFDWQDPTVNPGQLQRQQNVRSQDPTLLRLQAGDFDPVAHGTPDFSDSFPRQGGLTQGDRHYLVQFDGPIRQGHWQALKEKGIQALEYIPNNALMVRMSPGAASQLENYSPVRWVGPLEPGFKIDRGLALDLLGRGPFAERNLSPKDMAKETTLMVSLHGGINADHVVPQIHSSSPHLSVQSISSAEDYSAIRISAPRGQLLGIVRKLTNLEGVSHIGPYQMPTTSSNHNPAILQSGTDSTTINAGNQPIWFHGIMGAGQTIAMADSGLTSGACYFRENAGTTGVTAIQVPPSDDLTPFIANTGGDHTVADFQNRKVVVYNTYTAAVLERDEGATDYDAAGHGTMTTQVAAGDNYANLPNEGTFDPGHDALDGMAPLAQVAFFDVGGTDAQALPGVPDLEGIWMMNQMRQAGANISNHSYGGGTSFYGLSSADVDNFHWQVEDFLAFYAAGNSGLAAATIDSNGNAKNNMVVGGSQNPTGNIENMYTSSSTGPAADGRTKPDILAGGSSIDGFYVTGNNTSTACGSSSSSQGTSFSSPAAAGAGLLVRQYFTDGFYPSGDKGVPPAQFTTPSAALIKATMLSGAKNMTGSNVDDEAPTSMQGWGRVFLDNALWFSDEPAQERPLMWDFWHANGLATGESFATQIYIDGSAEFKATLVWTDAPGSKDGGAALVNDLDLVLVAEDGTSYWGNQWTGTDGDASNNNKVSVADPSGKDSLNNVEGLRLRTSDLTPGTYTLMVQADRVIPFDLHARQGFSLVVRGGIPGDRGHLSFDRALYDCDGQMQLRLVDSSVGADQITITTESGDSLTVSPTGTSPLFTTDVTYEFNTPINTGDSILQVVGGETITATYSDSDPSGHVVQTTARVDCGVQARLALAVISNDTCDNDEWLDDGESADLTLTVQNTSSGTMADSTLTLYSDNVYVFVQNNGTYPSTITIPSLAPGAEVAIGPFGVSASGAPAKQLKVDMRARVQSPSGAGGVSVDLDFTLALERDTVTTAGMTFTNGAETGELDPSCPAVLNDNGGVFSDLCFTTDDDATSQFDRQTNSTHSGSTAYGAGSNGGNWSGTGEVDLLASPMLALVPGGGEGRVTLKTVSYWETYNIAAGTMFSPNNDYVLFDVEGFWTTPEGESERDFAFPFAGVHFAGENSGGYVFREFTFDPARVGEFEYWNQSPERIALLWLVVDDNASQTGTWNIDDITATWDVDEFVDDTNDACTPVCTAPGIPANLSGSATGFNGVTLTWDAVTGADHYNIYGTMGGSCGAGTLLATVFGETNTIWEDFVNGGSALSYHVTAVSAENACESAASNCTTVTPLGGCISSPNAVTNMLAVSANQAACQIDVSWTASTSICGTTPDYNIYRSNEPFAPGPATLLTTTSITSYSDLAVASGVDGFGAFSGPEYFYAVRAVDPVSNEESNDSTLVSAFATNAGTLGTWTDDAGDTGVAKLTPSLPWNVSNLRSDSGGAFSYRSSYPGTDDASMTPPDSCAAITTPPINIGGSPSVLTFSTTYLMENAWDGVVVEISGNGVDWVSMDPAGGYPGDFSATLGCTEKPDSICNECHFPPAQGSYSNHAGCGDGNFAAWTNDTTTQFSLVGTHTDLQGRSLTVAVSDTIYIRWNQSTDPGCDNQGFHLDDISITNVILPVPCTDGACLVGPTFTGLVSAVDVDNSADSGVQLTWGPISSWGDGTTGVYEIYVDSENVATVTDDGSASYSYLWGAGDGEINIDHSFGVRAVSDCGTATGGQEIDNMDAAQALTGAHVVGDATYTTSLSEVCGDGDSVVEPGERWDLNVRLINLGSSDATNTVASLGLGSGSDVAVTFLNNPRSLGTLSAGGATATTAFRFEVDSGAACPGTLVYDITSVSSNEGSYPDASNVLSSVVGEIVSDTTEDRNQTTDPLTVSNTNNNTNLGVATTLAGPVTSAGLSFDLSYTNNGGNGTLNQAGSTGSVPTRTTTTFSATEAVAQTIAANGVTVDFDLAPKPSRGTSQTLVINLSHDATGTNVDLYNGSQSGAPGVTTFGPLGTFDGLTTQTTWTLSITHASGGGGANTNGTLNSWQMNVDFGSPALGSLTANVQLELVQGASSTIIKAFGAGMPSMPVDVSTFYDANGAGLYELRLTEDAGADANLTNGFLSVREVITACNVASCSGGASPVPAPDGTNSTTPLGAAVGGAGVVDLSWDIASCTSTEYNLIYGVRADLAAYSLTGNDCSIGTSGSHSWAVSDPASGEWIWYLIVGEDASTESTWGNDSAGAARKGTTASGVCGNAARDNGGTCP